MVSSAKKKLLVLDVNGLLIDTYSKNDKRPNCRADIKVNKHHVYRRPYCNEFIEFCFENFEIGIWSSCQKHNLEGYINFIFGDSKSKLLFRWHQGNCTNTGFKTPGNRYKPVFLKELSKLWNKVKPDLPWEKGDFGPSNTLLIDDSPYKALRNPPYTAVFPDPYKVSNNFDDSLGGALRKYLEGLATASDVQYYVKHHPFGQPPISKESPYWNLYRKILLPLEDSAPYIEKEENDMANAAIPKLEMSVPSKIREDGLHTDNVQHSELSSCIDKREKKRRNHPVTSTNQSSVPGEEEGNVVVKVAVLKMEKYKSLENKKRNLESGNGPHSESSLRSGKHKKRRKNCLGTCTNESSVPGEKEDNGVVKVAVLKMEKFKSSENIKETLESSSCIGKPENKHRKHPVTSTNQSSVPGDEEGNGVVKVAVLKMEKCKSSENIKGNLESGNGPHSESSLQIGKHKKRRKKCLGTYTNESSVPGEEEDNGVVKVAVLKMEKFKSLEDIKGTSELSSCIGKPENKHRKHPVASTNQSSVSGDEEGNGVVKVAVLKMDKCKSLENIKGNLESGNGPQSESSSWSGKHKKRCKNHLGTNTNETSVPNMEEDNNVINKAMLDMEKSIASENIRDNLESGNGLQSEVSSWSGKRKKRCKDQSSVPIMEEDNSVVNMTMLNMEKSISLENIRGNLQSGKRKKKRHKDHLSTSINQSSVPSMEEENDVVNVAMLNMEKSVSLENRKVNLQSGNGQQSESSLRSGKQKKRRKDQCSVPSMEEDNSVVNMAMLNMEKSISSEYIRGNSQSGKRKKRRKDHLSTSTNQSSVPSMEEENSVVNIKQKKRRKDQSSVPSMEEDNSVVNMAMLNMEKSISLENIRGNSQSGKRKKRCKNHPSTSTDQSSVPSMEEENSVVNIAILNMETIIPLENRKVNLQSNNGQQSESSSRSGKRKKRQRDCPLTGTSESFLGKQTEMGMPDVGKSRSITQDLLSQEHESCRIYRGYKNAKLLSEHGKPSKTGLSQNSPFSNHKRKHNHFPNASMSRGSVPAVEEREDG